MSGQVSRSVVTRWLALVGLTLLCCSPVAATDLPPFEPLAWDLSYAKLFQQAKPEYVSYFRSNLEKLRPESERLLQLARRPGVQSMILLEELPGGYPAVKLLVRTKKTAYYYGLQIGMPGRLSDGSKYGADVREITVESYDHLYGLLARRAASTDSTPKDTGTVAHHPASGRHFVTVVNLYRDGQAKQLMLSAADYFTRAVPPVLDDINAQLFAGMHYRKYASKWEWAWQLENQIVTVEGKTQRVVFDAAVARGDHSAAEAILLQGMDVNSLSAGGNTAYIAARVYGQQAMAEWLVSRGADPLGINVWGETAADVVGSTSAGRLEGAEPNIDLRRKTWARVVASPHMKGDTNPQLRLNQLLMEMLEDEAAMDFVITMLNKGADPHYVNNAGVTPLMLAAGNAPVEVLNALLDRNVNVNARNVNGSTALHYAASAGRAKNVKVLLAHGADANVANHKGETPLRQAQWQRFDEIVTLLKATGAK